MPEPDADGEKHLIANRGGNDRRRRLAEADTSLQTVETLDIELCWPRSILQVRPSPSKLFSPMSVFGQYDVRFKTNTWGGRCFCISAPVHAGHSSINHLNDATGA